MRHGDGSWSESLVQGSAQARRHLETLVRDDLSGSPYADLKRVTCTQDGNVLILSGRVASYYLKQLAQRIALERAGKDAIVVNQLQVEA
jgi:hypothetical protein